MKTIMIIDDDVHIGNMLEEVLTREGYQVSRAYSGTEALLVLADHRPDLVLLDLMLPGLRGEEVLPELKGIPVIVVSARSDVQDKIQLLLGGAADYVTKPFDTRELLARITVRLREVPAEGAAERLVFDAYSYMDEDGTMVQEDAQPNPKYLTGTKRKFYEFLNDANPMGQMVQYTNIEVENPGLLMLYSFGIIILSTAAGVVIFRKKDVK